MNLWGCLRDALNPKYFFPVQEWIALHSCRNDPPVWAGYGIVMIILLLHERQTAKRKGGGIGSAVRIVLFLACLFCLIPCLCMPREKALRSICCIALREANLKLKEEADRSGVYPDSLPEGCRQLTRNRTCAYPGAGKTPSNEPFILIEDEPCAHAGDLRHRLWSNGKIDSYYPWKSQENAE